MQMQQIEKLRTETPGCHDRIHFNNAGAALLPLPVVNAVKEHLDLEMMLGGYEAHAEAFSKEDKFYDHAAELINCERDEIAFVENATRAWDMAFYSFKFKPGDKIVTARAEYASNYLAFLQMANQTGAVIEVIDDDASGQLDLHTLEKKLDERVKLIAITHVPTQGGLINPAEDIGKLAKKFAIPYLLDATQSIGQMPIDVKAIGCDFLCATGRKYLRGPRGTGFLYAKKTMLLQSDPPFVDLQAATWTKDNAYELKTDGQRFETWERSVANKIGLATAIQYALAIGMPLIWERIQHLANLLRKQLQTIPSVTLQDKGKNKCGIVTFTSSKITPDKIKAALFQQNINVSISIVEYARLDMSSRHLASLVRASVHYYNTEEEIVRFCDGLVKILQGCR